MGPDGHYVSLIHDGVVHQNESRKGFQSKWRIYGGGRHASLFSLNACNSTKKAGFLLIPLCICLFLTTYMIISLTSSGPMGESSANLDAATAHSLRLNEQLRVNTPEENSNGPSLAPVAPEPVQTQAPSVAPTAAAGVVDSGFAPLLATSVVGDKLEKISRDFFDTEETFLEKFEEFVEKFERKYASAKERLLRFGIFKKNLAYITTHNQQGFSYSLEVNNFADMTHDEFKSHYVGYKQPEKAAFPNLGTATELLTVDEASLPDSIDWRAKGCVTEVKDQKQCGSCWAFSATGSLEGAACAATGHLPDLSEQQLVDCASSEGNMGCNGGQMDLAFKYVMDNKGLCSEQDYPYNARGGECMADQCTNAVHIDGFKDVPHTELALRAAIAHHGPVSVAIEADQMPFQFYKKGVFDASCGRNLDHGVLVVGYGTDEKSGEDYWIVKNSWGPAWGSHGFIYMARHKGRTGECGILLGPSYPIIRSAEETDE